MLRTGDTPVARHDAAVLHDGERLEPDEVAQLIEADLDTLATEHGLVEERQRSMRSVLDASWRLLGADQ